MIPTPVETRAATGPLPGTDAQTEAQVQETIRRQQMEDAAGRRAAATAMPGATAEAFKLPQEIAVGPLKFRALTDGDFETLGMLDHPLHEMMKQSLDGKTPEANTGYQPRGPQMWVLCWMLTHTPDQVDELIAKGRLAFIAEAKKAFSHYNLVALVAFNKAIIEQVTRYWAPVQGYSAVSPEGEQGSPPSSSPSGAP